MVTAVSHPPLVTRYLAHTNQGFLLREISLVAHELLSGRSHNSVRASVLEDDLFQLSATDSRKTTLSAVMARLDGADEELLSFLVEGGLSLRRLTNLYLFLLRHRLLREFIAEILFDELRRFGNSLRNSDVNAFFERKRVQVPAVAAWSEATLEKSRSNVITVLHEADLLSSGPSTHSVIQPQLVPTVLAEALVAANRQVFLTLLLDRSSI